MASGTPSAQIRVRVRDLVFSPSPPPLMLTLYYWGKKYPAPEKLVSGRLKIIFGGIILRERQRTAGAGAGGPKEFEKNPAVLKIVV